MRTGGAEAVAFDADLPRRARMRRCRTGRRGDGRSEPGRSSCSTSGPRSTGYRSDMTRTLFVGEPTERDLAVYELVAAAQAAAIAQIEATVGRRAAAADRPRRSTRSPAR